MVSFTVKKIEHKAGCPLGRGYQRLTGRNHGGRKVYININTTPYVCRVYM